LKQGIELKVLVKVIDILECIPVEDEHILRISGISAYTQAESLLTHCFIKALGESGPLSTME